MTFRLTHKDADLWIVEKEVRRRWPFNSRWEQIGAFRTETEALELVKRNANFEPHTSYFDKYGNKLIKAVSW